MLSMLKPSNNLSSRASKGSFFFLLSARLSLALLNPPVAPVPPATAPNGNGPDSPNKFDEGTLDNPPPPVPALSSLSDPPVIPKGGVPAVALPTPSSGSADSPLAAASAAAPPPGVDARLCAGAPR